MSTELEKKPNSVGFFQPAKATEGIEKYQGSFALDRNY
ncbi:hypothetical protein LDG_6982 [Legionella drancourtii LLAP12]|uniref:Uncharacterized protein n=1 Tax=Legionella drancourtii LLAP12 TaxID=658187 RepID=G9EP02_9GAMM|nr:hypothetical protein LDG_6982 [Legionella drancourtii LLAP12]